MLEKRKEVRLNLANSWVQLSDNSLIKINNLSIKGINLNSLFTLNSKIEGLLFLDGQAAGKIQGTVVNNQGNTSGLIINNYLELQESIKPWFNPLELVSKLKPNSVNNNLNYEDKFNRCSFNFIFDVHKKITALTIAIHQNKVVWNSDSGWETFTHSNQKDLLLDQNKLNLAKEMIENSHSFPQSFKNWLVDLF